MVQSVYGREVLVQKLPWRTGKEDDIADVAHAGDKEDQTLKPKSKASMGDTAITAEVHIPIHRGGLDTKGMHGGFQPIEAGLSC